MPIRNLKDGKHLTRSLEAFEELQRRAEEVLTRYQSGSQSHSIERDDASRTVPLEKVEEADDRHPREVGVDLKTPPLDDSETPHDSDVDRDSKADDQAPESSGRIDNFMASLEALRTTLRSGSKGDNKADGADESQDQDLEPVDRADTESVSALDRLPLPDLPELKSPKNENTHDSKSDANSKQKNPEPDYTAPGSSLDEALKAVRKTIPGEVDGPVEYDTPPPKAKELKKRKKKNRRPLSDGIPKSVSEDLPKFRSRPKMRICNRCGHETTLREARCGKCGHTDESLGILDAVIAGDLARVEQILLARPHLIGVRTSRHEWTLLHMAASGGNPKMVELLIAKGASVNATNKDGKTSLHYAAGKGHLSIVKVLLANHADTEMEYHGKTCVELAREHHQDEIAKYLAEFRANS